MRSLIFSAFTLAVIFPSFSYSVSCGSVCPSGSQATCSTGGSCTCPGATCGTEGTCSCTTLSPVEFEIINKGKSLRVINPDELFTCKDGMQPVYYQSSGAYVCPVKSLPAPAAR